MSNYNSKNVTVQLDGAVLIISLARSPVNAFNDALWFELQEHIDQASGDNDVRCVVLCSSLEKLFTAGLDLTQSSLTSMQGADPGRTGLLLRRHIEELQNSLTAIEKCDKPVVAAVHGLCLGAGIDIIAACDVRYCSSNAVFSIKEVDVGLAADVGSLQRLPGKVANDSLLRELALTGRNFNAAEAVTLGLVSKVVEGGRAEVTAAAIQVAQIIARKSPIATLGTKHLLNYSKDHTVDEGLAYTTVWNMSMLQAEDLSVAFAAFANKKPAKYRRLGKL